MGGGGEAGKANPWDPGSPPQESRRSKLLSPFHAEGSKGVAIAVFSTIVVIALIVIVVLHSPNWLLFKQSFFNKQFFKETFPTILRAFLRNIAYFLMAEPLILALALLLAVMRSLPGPVFFPIRTMAVIYVDFFRGIPTILVVYLLGFGVPAMQIPGLPVSAWFWAVIGLVLSYSAYVAEVYRAGIESVHPSQTAAARSLGLSRWQTLRYVVVPQAVRRVIPPLLNDFIGLQKDTALVSVIGVAEAALQAQGYSQTYANFTSYTVAAVFFVLLTIPLARFTDHLIAKRERRERAAAT